MGEGGGGRAEQGNFSLSGRRREQTRGERWMISKRTHFLHFSKKFFLLSRAFLHHGSKNLIFCVNVEDNRALSEKVFPT